MNFTGNYALQIHDGLLFKEHLNGIQQIQSLKRGCLEHRGEMLSKIFDFMLAFIDTRS